MKSDKRLFLKVYPIPFVRKFVHPVSVRSYHRSAKDAHGDILRINALISLEENHSLRKHPFLLALRRWGVSRETSPATKSEEKRMFSQARKTKKGLLFNECFKILYSYFVCLVLLFIYNLFWTV